MRTVINLSASEAKKIKYLSTQDVLISINVPDEPLHELSIDRNSSRVLTVSFWDIYCKTVYKGEEIKPIDGETAMKIINFIRNWQRKNFIVHCQAGISRSGAVAMFIHQLYGHKLKPNFWVTSHPNPYVLGKLYLLHEQMPEKTSKQAKLQ